MKKNIAGCILAIIASLWLISIDAEAKKPEVTRHDAQYLDRQISVNLQWQSSEAIVSVRVAAGKEVKEIKIDTYDNKKTRLGYSGEVSVVLQTDPMVFQESIGYTIQVEDEDGQKSNLVTGKVAVPATAYSSRERDQWGQEKLAGTAKSGKKDIIEQLREVATVLAAPPVILDVTVNNPGTGTVTFKTKATHTVGMREITFRVFDASGKQVDAQQISATGKLWEGTSKDFTLTPGSYSVIAQAVDSSGGTSRESKASFTIGGTPTQPPVIPPVTPPVIPPVTPPVIPPVPQQNLPSVSDPVIYANGNIAGVQNNPTRETTFTITASHRVTFIYTYHYFNNGKLPGTIALRHSDGTVYGPWQTQGALGQGGVQNAYWFILPNVEIKAGSYTVVDSDKATWSHNSGSSGAGFVEIKGIRTGTPQPSFGEKEFLSNVSLTSLSGWTIHRWMQSTGDRGEVTQESDGIKFRNTAGNTRMGIMQTINADVSGAQKLILRAVVNAVQQNLTGTGWQGREAPVAVMVTYTDVSGVVRNGLGSMANPTESQTNRMFWHGFYYANPTGDSRDWNGTKVGQGSWYTYEVDLMSLNPKPKIIHAVGAEGSGWPTREGKITFLSLKYYGTLTGR